MSDERPWEKVKEDNYFRSIQANMVDKTLGPKEEVRVRFGLLGDGKSPHYQLEWKGNFRRFNGISHQAYHEDPLLPFEKTNISREVFTYDDIVDMRKRCLAPQPKK